MTVAGMDGIDLSANEFWGLPLAERAAAFAQLRAEPHPRFFAEPEAPFAEQGPGYYALVRHADVVEASKHPDVFSSAAGRDEHPGPAGRVQRVLRVDDQHGRPQARPAATDRLPRVQPAADRQVRRRRAPGGRRDRRRPAGHRAVRLRAERRGQAAAEDHLRHDGHPGRSVRHGPGQHQHHLVRGGPGVPQPRTRPGGDPDPRRRAGARRPGHRPGRRPRRRRPPRTWSRRW